MPYNYREKLLRVDSEIRQNELINLQFLCGDIVKGKKLENISDCHELFDLLEEQLLISDGDLSFLIELLGIIHRNDLVEYVDPDCEAQSVRTSTQNLVCPFRTMLVQLCQEITASELRSLRFAYGKVPRKDVIACGTQLFTIMMQRNDLGPDKLNIICDIMAPINRSDLSDQVKDFKEKFVAGGQYTWSRSQKQQESEPCAPDIESWSATEQEENPEKQGFMTHLDDHIHCNGEEPLGTGEEPSDKGEKPSDKGEKQSVENHVINHMTECLSHLSTSEHTNIPVHFESAKEVTNTTNESILGVLSPNLDQTANLSLQNPVLEIAAPHDHSEVPQGYMAEDLTPTPPPSHLGGLPALPTVDETLDSLEYYKMQAQPRGLCLIINNQNFHSENEIPALAKRVGSDIDAEKLTTTFQRLHFEVTPYSDQTDAQIKKCMRDIENTDHSCFDCFVCCILSHGGLGYIYGSNSQKVPISLLTSSLRAQNCASLRGKPKLFFLACCQGIIHQGGAEVVETDGPSDSVGRYYPNEADFLVGYATVPNSVSYRSRSRGTWYISELTKALDKYAEKENLQTLLVRVNRNVSNLTYVENMNENQVLFKQVPAPQHTLRSLLKFL